MTSFSFHGGILISLLVLMVLVALPLKIGAHLADAKRTGLIWCALSALVGVLAGHLASVLIGGAIGGPLAAAIGFILAIRFMLGTNLAGALGLTLIAWLVCLLGIFLLAHFAVITNAPGDVTYI
jgi:energy-converting hydrogenase Eha subunit B